MWYESRDSGGWRDVSGEIGESSNGQEYIHKYTWSKEVREKLSSRQALGLIWKNPLISQISAIIGWE